MSNVGNSDKNAYRGHFTVSNHLNGMLFERCSPALSKIVFPAPSRAIKRRPISGAFAIYLLPQGQRRKRFAFIGFIRYEGLCFRNTARHIRVIPSATNAVTMNESVKSSTSPLLSDSAYKLAKPKNAVSATFSTVKALIRISFARAGE